MKFTTDRARVCCGRTVFRVGRTVELTQADDIAAAQKHPDIHEYQEPVVESGPEDDAYDAHTPSALQAMNKADLAEIAASVGAECAIEDTKADMIDAIMEAQG